MHKAIAYMSFVWLLSMSVVQKNKQETLRGVADYCKKRPRALVYTETHESNRVSKKPKKSQKKILADLIEPRNLPTTFMDKSTGDVWSGCEACGGEGALCHRHGGQMGLGGGGGTATRPHVLCLVFFSSVFV